MLAGGRDPLFGSASLEQECCKLLRVVQRAESQRCGAELAEVSYHSWNGSSAAESKRPARQLQHAVKAFGLTCLVDIGLMVQQRLRLPQDLASIGARDGQHDQRRKAPSPGIGVGAELQQFPKRRHRSTFTAKDVDRLHPGSALEPNEKQ